MKESKKQERKNLMEDMPIDSRAGIMMKSGGTFMSKHSSPIRMSADLEYMPIDDKASAKMYGSKKPAMYGGKKPAMYGGKKPAMYGKGGPKMAPLAAMVIKAAVPAIISNVMQKKKKD